MKKFFFVLAFASALFAQEIYNVKTAKVLTVTGVIDPVIADYVDEELSKPDFDIAIISLNTPGGLMDATQDIIKSIMNCPKPVGVWIGPRGAKAASAGVFITVACDFSAMAPATNIGAAHPVQMGMGKGGEDTELSKKVLNDAIAYIQSIAKEKKRPLDWVKDAVEKSVSIGADEAVEKKIVDFSADSILGFLKKIDGFVVEKNKKRMKFATKNASINYVPMSQWKDFLHKLANPNIAFILMIIGIWGIIQEASSPGVGFGAVVGGISLLLAFFSLRILPINTVGLLLIILGLALLFLEFFTPTFGVLTLGGLVSLVLGGMMLIDKTKMTVGVSLKTILPTVGFLALFIIFVVGALVKSQKAKPKTGKEGLIGEEGKVLDDFEKQGSVLVHGEIWQAVSQTPLKKGEKVVVKDIKGSTLIVERQDG